MSNVLQNPEVVRVANRRRRPATPVGLLAANGLEIRNRGEAGERVHLCGVNLGGWFVHEPWMSPLAAGYDEHTVRAVLTRRFGAEGQRELYRLFQDAWVQEDDLAYLAALGMNAVRLPLYYQVLMDERGQWQRDAEGEIDFRRLDWLVETARAHGLYTILDLHGAPGSQNGRDHSGQSGRAGLFADPAWPRLTCEWWREVARHFRGNPAVAGYDLLNEPEGISGAAQWDFCDQLYRVVREADPEHLIFIEAIWNWQDLPLPERYGWRNVVYSNHYYMREDQGCAAQCQLVDWILSDLERYQRQRGYVVPQLLGEFCFFRELESWRYGLRRFRETGYNWVSWTYKVAQPVEGNWGLYYANDPRRLTVDPERDAFADIAAKWQNCRTASQFHQNEGLAAVIREALAGDPGLHRPL